MFFLSNRDIGVILRINPLSDIIDNETMSIFNDL